MIKKEYISKILGNMRFSELNEMQHAILKEYDKSNNIMLLSPTGSGKTLGFLLPSTYYLDRNKKEVQMMVIVPARELAIQINSVFASMKTGFSSVCCYGGHDIKKEINSLKESPAVIIGTPGRILDHLKNGNFNPATITTLVLDEFDKSLEMGFTEEMESIISYLKNLKKKILTSATEAIEVPAYIDLQNPVRLNFTTNEKNSGLTLYQVASPVPDKLETLRDLLCSIDEGQKIVFCNYRESAERVSDYLKKQGLGNVFFHGGLDQVFREKTIARFKNMSINTLVSTDLAARGLDIDDVKHIIHYHLPSEGDSFTHRNGRTARMNRTGNAYVILGPDEYMPDYVDAEPIHFNMPAVIPAPHQTLWETIYIGKGKKDKLSKGDVLGFLIKQGGLDGSQIGIIEVKDNHCFAAVKESVSKELIKKVKGLKIKNMKTVIEIAR